MRMLLAVLAVLACGCLAPRKSASTLQKAVVAANAGDAAIAFDGVDATDNDVGDTGIGGDLASDQVLLVDAAEDNMVTDAATADAATDVASGPAEADALTTDSAPATPDAVAVDSASGFHVTGGIVVVPTRKKTPEFAVHGEGLLNKRVCGQGLCAIGGIRP